MELIYDNNIIKNYSLLSISAIFPRQVPHLPSGFSAEAIIDGKSKLKSRIFPHGLSIKPQVCKLPVCERNEKPRPPRHPEGRWDELGLVNAQ
jgi:hypothetical protein